MIFRMPISSNSLRIERDATNNPASPGQAPEMRSPPQSLSTPVLALIVLLFADLRGSALPLRLLTAEQNRFLSDRKSKSERSSFKFIPLAIELFMMRH
jgi:hypothetical protein